MKAIAAVLSAKYTFEYVDSALEVFDKSDGEGFFLIAADLY